METHTIKPLVLATQDFMEMNSYTYLSYADRQAAPVPFVMWYVKAGNKNVLVDTAIEADDFQNFHPLFKFAPVKAVRTFEEALQLVDCTPDDIDVIIHTHLHIDHVYNNTVKCKNAEVFVQKKELDFALNPHPIYKEIIPTDLIKKIDFSTIDGDQTILPGISVIFTPGHTPGGQSVVVETSKGKAIITGFCCTKENFNVPEDVNTTVSPFATYPVIAPGIHTNLLEGFESAQRVKKMADIIIPLHEPDMAFKEEIP